MCALCDNLFASDEVDGVRVDFARLLHGLERAFTSDREQQTYVAQCFASAARENEGVRARWELSGGRRGPSDMAVSLARLRAVFPDEDDPLWRDVLPAAWIH